MKHKFVASALLVLLVTVGTVSQASARPWGNRGGWGGPHIGVRVEVPAPIIVGGYGGGYGSRGGYNYGSQRYYEHRECAPRYNGYNDGYRNDRGPRGSENGWHR